MATPPPRQTLDSLFATLPPVVGQLTGVYAQAMASWAPESTKNAWIGSLNQASAMLTRASIEGEQGQLLSMGEVSIATWKNSVEQAANLISYVGQEINGASYSVVRFWREVVIPTAVQAADAVTHAAETTFVWAPWVIGGLVVLYVFSAGQGLRRALSPFGGAAPRRRRARR